MAAVPRGNCTWAAPQGPVTPDAMTDIWGRRAAGAPRGASSAAGARAPGTQAHPTSLSINTPGSRNFPRVRTHPCALAPQQSPKGSGGHHECPQEPGPGSWAHQAGKAPRGLLGGTGHLGHCPPASLCGLGEHPQHVQGHQGRDQSTAVKNTGDSALGSGSSRATATQSCLTPVASRKQTLGSQVSGGCHTGTTSLQQGCGGSSRRSTRCLPRVEAEATTGQPALFPESTGVPGSHAPPWGVTSHHDTREQQHTQHWGST